MSIPAVTRFVDTNTLSNTSTIGIGRTLADCQYVASLFDSTCDSLDTPIDISTHEGAQMSCTGQMMCPDGSGSKTYTEADPCTFTRKLCVTCQEKNNDVYIRVQSNQMPNHCFQAINENPYSTNVSDFEVIWNRDVTGMMNVSEDDVDSQSKTEELMCDI